MWRAPAVRAALAVLVVLAMAGVVLHPAVRATAKAPFVLADTLDLPLPRPLAAPVERSVGEPGGVAADRYLPGRPAPPVLVLPGAAPAGRDDERVVAFSSALAAAGREVVVPELALYDQRIDPADVERVVRVAGDLCAAADGLVLLGFSYGGSLALVAAADDRIASCVDLVATFGAYGDLVGVLEAAVTGMSVVDGEVYPWRGADESVVRTVLRNAVTGLVPEEDRGALRRALDAQDPRGLSAAGMLVYRMVTAEEPGLVRTLAERLPSPGREIVATYSPVAVADRIEARVLAIHAYDDPAVPVAELLRLHRALPEAEVMTVRSFRHVDLAAEDGVGVLVEDLVTAGAFVQGVLRAQERWPWKSWG